ncbi:MAG: 50S ribosomal protein L4 [Anaerolineae bacterium]|nr:50S ribosomal protein L4 [Anaerolineae bacterium]
MLVPVRNMDGETVGEAELRDDIFGARVSRPLMHQALVRQLANARQGTHSTRTRGEVRGSTRKIYRQKGTGRARHGSMKVNLWPGGGVVFGPHPRSYRQDMPRKMRRAAYRSALTVKAQDEQIVVLDALELSAPKTRDMKSMIARLGIEGSVLIMLPDRNENVELSVRNLPDVKALRASYVNVRDLLGYDYLLLPRDSLAVIERVLG